MKPENNIENFFDKAGIDTNPAKDEKVLNKILAAQTKASLWRLIMEGLVTKLAVAAVFIAGIFILFIYSSNVRDSQQNSEPYVVIPNANNTIDLPKTDNKLEENLLLANQLFANNDISGLSELLNNELEAVRFQAAEFLGQIGNETVITQLQMLAEKWDGLEEDNIFENAILNINNRRHESERAVASEHESVIIHRPEEIFIDTMSLFGSPRSDQPSYNVVLRVYDPESQDENTYKKITLETTNNRMIFNGVTLGKSSRTSGANHNRLIFDKEALGENTKIVMAGWDQTDPNLKAVLENVIVVGTTSDDWSGPYIQGKSKLPNILITDTMGKPIPGKDCSITIMFSSEDFMNRDSFFNNTIGYLSFQIDDAPCDSEGNAILPYICKTTEYPASGIRNLPMFRKSIIQVSHPEYGTCLLFKMFDDQTMTIRTPLVKEGTVEAERAISGQVVELKDNYPIPYAMISCDNIRTAGEGLIETEDQSYIVTDSDGKFRFYPIPAKKNEDNLIPPHSTFHVDITAVGYDDLLPDKFAISNDEPAIIKLRSGDAFHTFEFALDDPNLINNSVSVNVNYALPDEENPSHSLPKRCIDNGGLIPYGTYYASLFMGINNIELIPIEITPESPEVIVFKPKAPLIYTGRILDGSTKQPLSDTLIASYEGSKQKTFVMLTDEDWEILNRFDLDEQSRQAAYKCIGELCSFETMVRTNEQGYYWLELEAGKTTHSLVYFKKDYTPFRVPVHILKSENGEPIVIHDVYLYPSATINVIPVVIPVTDTSMGINPQNKHYSIMPRWVIDPKNNPQWALDMIPWINWKYQNDGQFVYDDWMEANSSNLVLVPADVNLKIQLRTPYDDELDDIVIPVDIKLGPGEYKDLDEWQLAETKLFYIHVTDTSGNPVEGLPLRQVVAKNSYGVTHNTDKNGDTTFYGTPGTEIGISVLLHDLVENFHEYKQPEPWQFLLPDEDTKEIFHYNVTISDEILALFNQKKSR